MTIFNDLIYILICHVFEDKSRLLYCFILSQIICFEVFSFVDKFKICAKYDSLLIGFLYKVSSHGLNIWK